MVGLVPSTTTCSVAKAVFGGIGQLSAWVSVVDGSALGSVPTTILVAVRRVSNESGQSAR